MNVGVDETGRGSCIGRLYVAACVMPADTCIGGLLIDSKKLSAKRLMDAEAMIRRTAVAFSVGYATQEEVESLNPTQATTVAWHRCLDDVRSQLGAATFDRDITEVVVDGTNFRPWVPVGTDRAFAHRTLPKADATVASVAAASILAKAERDRYIRDLCVENPELDRYDINKNKGYPSPSHKRALAIFGRTVFHRANYNIKPS